MMTYEEYAAERDSVLTSGAKNGIFEHVRQRLNERHAIDLAYGSWTRLSYECAIRKKCEEVGRKGKSIHLRRTWQGVDLTLVYDRNRKCVMTVL